MATTSQVETQDLERRVKEVYRHVALRPEETYHFEMGRALAERLGYPASLLDRIPAAAIDSFAGVGYYLDLAEPALVSCLVSPFTLVGRRGMIRHVAVYWAGAAA